MLHQNESTNVHGGTSAAAVADGDALSVAVDEGRSTAAEAMPRQTPQDGPCCDFDPYDADVWADADAAVLLALRVLDDQPAAIRHRAAVHLLRDAEASSDRDAPPSPRGPR